MMQKGAFWALNKGIALDASKKHKEKAKAAEYFQASADLYEKVINSDNPPFPGKEGWAAATYKNVGIAYGRLQHVPDNSKKMALAFETYLARSDPKVDQVDQRFEMHRCVLLWCFEYHVLCERKHVGLTGWELGCVSSNFELEQSNCFPAFFIYRLVASYRTTVGFGDAGPNEEQDLVR